MANSVPKRYFPSQVVSDLEKVSYDYGLKVAKAIENEWYSDNHGKLGSSYSMHSANQKNFHNLKLMMLITVFMP